MVKCNTEISLLACIKSIFSTVFYLKTRKINNIKNAKNGTRIKNVKNVFLHLWIYGLLQPCGFCLLKFFIYLSISCFLAKLSEWMNECMNEYSIRKSVKLIILVHLLMLTDNLSVCFQNLIQLSSLSLNSFPGFRSYGEYVYHKNKVSMSSLSFC